MKNKSLKLIYSSIVFILAVFMVSCSSKLTPLSSSLFSVQPSPMEVKGSQIPVTINGKFPPKWFNKNAEVTVTPVLKSGNSEKYGTSVTYQGEKVAGNGIVINQADGGNFTIKSAFDYEPGMENAELYLRFTTKIKNKETELPDVLVAQGVVTTETLANAYTNSPSIAPDGFQKLIQEMYDANILFLIQQAKLRPAELNSTDIKAWQQLVKEAENNQKQKVNVEVQAYASPDGGYKLNEKLAEQREKNTTAYLQEQFKKENVNTNVYANYTAQDWEGFKRLVEVSNLPDKDLILRVISMYRDPADREREIKNISVVYKDLAETILPQLRRSRLVANIETIGKSDAELLQIANNNPQVLNLNELLYTANLEGAPTGRIYELVVQKYPNDYRGWNNQGAYFFAQGDIANAKVAYAKAQQLNKTAPETSVNLGLLALADNKVAQAEQLIGSAAQADAAGEALGLVYLKKGEYNKAVQAFGDVASNNAALAQLLNKDYSKAEQTLNAVVNQDGTTSYLKAIVAARTNDAAGVASNLKKAFNADSSLKQRATNDVEFAKFANNAVVSGVLK